MKCNILAVLFFCSFICLQSCEHEDIIAPELRGTGDSLLIKKIRLQYNDPTDPVDHTYIPLYDSLTRSLSIYLDDLTTETLQDKIFRKYEFNEDGYLTKMWILDTNGILAPQFWLLRNANNQIEKLVHYDIFEYDVVVADTLHFTYTGNLVQDSFQHYLRDYITQVTVFNEQKKVLSIRKEDENYWYLTYDFFYNNQGLLRSVITTGDTTDMLYDPAPLSEAWLKQGEFFLGRDTWLLQHIMPRATFGFSFLTFQMDNEFNKFYDPLFHRPMLSQTMHGYYYYSNDPVVRTVNFVNTYNSQNMLTSQKVTGNGNYTVTFTFTY